LTEEDLKMKTNVHDVLLGVCAVGWCWLQFNLWLGPKTKDLWIQFWYLDLSTIAWSVTAVIVFIVVSFWWWAMGRLV